MPDKMRVLIIDDEPVVCNGIERILLEDGYETETAVRTEDGIRMLREKEFDLLVTDMKMPKISGMEVLEYVKGNFPEIQVIIITGFSTVKTAVESIKKGAFDYVSKPFTPEEILHVVREASKKRKRILEEVHRSKAIGSDNIFDNIIGGNEEIRKIFRLIKKVAPTDATVLITGESGTGKELIARAIYNHSLRKDNQFIAVDCSTLSQSLLESELFGHVRGSFTGASSDKRGIFEIADGGTLFLDEVSNIPLHTQVKLLRVLEEHEYRPVGDEKVKKSDIRLIAATNQDLNLMVEKQKFRNDLFYRLNVFSLNVPPLRERPEDIPLLANHFLGIIRQSLDKEIKGFSREAMEILTGYEWPGNVRELKNFVERQAIITEEEVLTLDRLPEPLNKETAGGVRPEVPRTSIELKRAKKLAREKSVNDLEKSFILDALTRNGWSVTRAAGDTGMQRPNFQKLMKKFGVKIRNNNEYTDEETDDV